MKKKLLSRREARSVLYKLVLKSRQLQVPIHASTHVTKLEQALMLDSQIGMLADRIEQFVTGDTRHKEAFN